MFIKEGRDTISQDWIKQFKKMMAERTISVYDYILTVKMRERKKLFKIKGSADIKKWLQTASEQI